MELKGYQHNVIKDLEQFLDYVHRHDTPADAFNAYWYDRSGPYNPLDGTGMQPYKNTVPGAIHVCIKVPTAGGKTFIACNALHSIFKAQVSSAPKTVMWLVPWSNLLDQTVNNLRNPDHPYRQKLDALFNHRVEVYEKKDLLQGSNFNPTVVKEQLSVFVMSFASLRAKNKEDRKVNQQNSQLAGFVPTYADRSLLRDDIDESALTNVIRSFNPVLVVDESHNAESDLSVDMMQSLNPSFILDLTATPKENSNIISMVPAIELKKENMVKLPVIVYNHHDKTEVINNALHLQQNLEYIAEEEEAKSGRFIRPVVLFQAQPRKGDENTTFDKLKQHLLDLKIPAERIKIKTADRDELKGIDLGSRDCEVRYIITINALKEGWDCPFAYILASLADRSSAVDVEQILGRVLRQPYVTKHGNEMLNMSYVLTASAKFNETLQGIVKGLQASGFSARDYRHKNLMTAETAEAIKSPDKDEPLFEDEGIDISRVTFSAEESSPQRTSFIASVKAQAVAESEEMRARVAAYAAAPPDEHLFEEMGDKVKRYAMVDAHRAAASKVRIPQFFLNTPVNDIFGGEKPKLTQSLLLQEFNLAKQDSKVDFEQMQAELYQIDLEKTRNQDSVTRFSRIERAEQKDPIIEYILGRPQDRQIKDIAHQLVQLIGDMIPVSDSQICAYIERILNELGPAQLQEVLIRKWSYADRIRAKIQREMDLEAEIAFDKKVKLKQVYVAASWKFPEKIVPGLIGPAIANSLYEAEGSMNSLEQTFINAIAGLPEIAFWHRNLGKGKGFAINGYKSNHYPDFILMTRKGTVVLVETKGDDRDNSDSAAKCKLGLKWEELAGPGFNYFMVFSKKPIDGAHTMEEAIAMIRMV